ncbi:hypothetical protein FRC10_009268 [Ceratobasidium sp. 414]|nr:hypothetical protein FRC10_009268 [Ceratobasidium sp. 414]
MLIANVLHWLLRVLLRRPILARGPNILYVLTLAPTVVLYRHLTTIGLPRREPNTGALISPGEDLAQPGITEWCWDIIYIPLYAGVMLYTKFIGPMFFNKGVPAPAAQEAAAPGGQSKRQQKLQQRAEKGDPRVKQQQVRAK